MISCPPKIFGTVVAVTTPSSTKFTPPKMFGCVEATLTPSSMISCPPKIFGIDLSGKLSFRVSTSSKPFTPKILGVFPKTPDCSLPQETKLSPTLPNGSSKSSALSNEAIPSKSKSSNIMATPT